MFKLFPGPPPGMPRMMPRGPMPMPRLMGPIPGMPPPPPVPMSNAQKNTPVLSAAPQLNKARNEKDGGKTSTTIEAKPQIRNLAADVTRFLPTSLRAKGKSDDKKKTSIPAAMARIPERIPEPQVIARPPQPLKTKDDAYMQFMQEMQQLL